LDIVSVIANRKKKVRYPMIGAIEFLRKAKAICDNTHPCADECPLNGWCHHEDDMNDADLVRKVMEYRLEDGDES
jgi:hypothetical protein